MIEFRCWYCNRRHVAPEHCIGERLSCGCGYLLRVPRNSGGNCRVKTMLDWIVERAVYAGAGALAGFFLDLLIATRLRFWLGPDPWLYLAALPLAGFLFGALGGERAVGWIVSKFRDE